MNTGRYTMRPWSFQAWIFRPWSLAGGADAAVTEPNAGWMTQTRQRLAVSETRNRLIMPETRNRLWISPEKVE